MLEKNLNAKKYIPVDERLKGKNVRIGNVYMFKNALEYLNIPNSYHTGNKQCVIGNIDEHNVRIYLLNSHMSKSAQYNPEHQKNYINIYKDSLMETNENFEIKKTDFLNMINSGQIECIGVCNKPDLEKIEKVENSNMSKRQSVANYQQYNQQNYNFSQYNNHYGYNNINNKGEGVYGNYYQGDGYYYGYWY